MHPVIFDNDIGIDDAMALLLLHYAESVELLAITTRFGNASIADTTRNALIMKDLFGIEAPVFQGAATPMGERLGEGFPIHVHGENGLGDIDLPAPRSKIDPMPAAEALVEVTKEGDGEAIIIAVGGLTNIAQALELDSNFADRVKQLIIMGGAFGYNRHNGNVSPVAEANIASDPQAADIVFRSGMATTIVGLDVTHEIIMDRPYMQSLLEYGGEAGKFIANSHQYYLDFHHSLSGRFECPLHDSAAIAYLLAPDLFATINQPVRAVTEGIAMGQTIHGDDLREYVSSAWDDVADSTICIGVDGPAVLELCRSILSTAAKDRNN